MLTANNFRLFLTYNTSFIRDIGKILSLDFAN